MMAFLRKYVLHNLWLKLVALLAAVLLWAAVARDPVAEIEVMVPVEFQHVPDNLEISSGAIPQAQIRVRGRERLLRTLAQSQVHAIVDLAQARPGERTYDLTGPHIRVPRGIEVVQVVPAQLHLSFDLQGRKEVPIQPRLTGLAGGGSQVQVRVDPPQALIVGPAKRVQNVAAAFTDAVDVAGVVDQATFPGVHIYCPDPLVRVAYPLAVSVSVEEKPVAKPAAPVRPQGQ